MDSKKLQHLLEEAGVPDELYNLHEAGRDDEKFCLCKKGEQWQVYFSERGVKTINKVFNTETEACQYIYEQLIDWWMLYYFNYGYTLGL